MNYQQIREKFRDLSGHHELVNKDGSDNGAGFFINEGRKYLDRVADVQKSHAQFFKILEVGRYSVSIPSCRAIKEVWIANATNGRWQLIKKNLQDLVAGYLANLPSERMEGTPLYYSPCITRYIPENADISELGAFLGYVEVPAGNAHEYNSILLNVPVQYQSMIDVRGKFYSHELSGDEDTNYWSSQHPMLLYMAAMRQLEVVNRNSQGVNDWTAAIDSEMKQLEFDLVDELISEVDQMKG